jgi:hypothetical protein
MSSYLLSLNLLLTNTNIIIIKTTLQKQYNKMLEYLKYYHSNWKENQASFDKINSNIINFAWSQFLGHYYFSHYELEIGGQIVEQYSADQFHIYQLHHLKEEQITNYFTMIANVPEITDFNNTPKPSKILLIPLVFWFCKNSGSSLPLVAMRNSTVIINLTINSLTNLLYFRDYELEYNNLLIITIPYTNQINTNLNYKNYTYNITNKKITYYCLNLNYEALKLNYSILKDDDINLILNNFGSNNIITCNQWIYFKNNINNYPSLMNKIGGYETFINYNYLLSTIPSPKIKLLAENIFLDDVERNKFASTRLEYVVECFQENIFDIYNFPIFSGDLSIDRPNKYLKWFIQPKNYLYGISEYGKVTPYIFNYSKYFINPIFDKQIITLNAIELLHNQVDYSYYNLVSSYQALNRTLPQGIYFYNFSLHPEEIQPSGTANFSIITEKKFRYEMNINFLNEYFKSPLNPNNVGLQLKVMSCSYNFFVVNHGFGRLIFSIS